MSPQVPKGVLHIIIRDLGGGGGGDGMVGRNGMWDKKSLPPLHPNLEGQN